MKPSKQIDFYRLVSLNINSLKLFRLWFYIPYPVLSVRFWLHIFVRVASGILIFTIPSAGQIAYLVKWVMSGDYKIQGLASSINLILTESLASIKLVDMLFRRDLLSKLIDQLMNGDFPRAEVHHRILKNGINVSRRIFKCLLVGAGVDVFFHVVIVPGLNGFQNLPLKMDLLFIDITDPKYFGYACFYQIIYKPAMVTSYIAVQTLPWAFLIFAITQLDILIYNFENMKKLIKERRAEKNCSEDDAFKEIFTGCVLHHRAIIRYQNFISQIGSKICLKPELSSGVCGTNCLTRMLKEKTVFLDTAEAAFRSQFALTLLFNGCIICCTGVQFFSIESLTKDFIDVFWVLAYLQIFVMIQFGDCYFGNAVYKKSTEIATVAFGCPWLTLSTESKKNLAFFMARAQKPMLITAYNLVPITLPTFTKVMNWTYKAFAVMNEMKK